MAKQTDQLLGHADEADGIEEYDNPAPDWLMAMFLGTILWSVAYTAYHFMVPAASQTALYEAEMAAAAERWPTPDAPETLAMDPETLAAGEGVFTQTCVACHKADLTGGIGPSLVDDVWVHGNSPEQIRAVIQDGVAAKGMPAWGPVLGPAKVAQVTAYVLSKQPPGAAPVPPQGSP